MRNTQQNKVTAAHLRRKAYLYIRQSTLHQVFNNTESTRRQYDLRQRAVALGWADEQVVTIDCDLGRSGAATDREGFLRLVAEVGTGNAGIVMGLEVSRLARNSSDWHRLLEICALSDTLILDEDGIYDPAHFNDRLLLGLKGTMSEAELHVLRARLHGGYMAKARRGELQIRLPVGLVYDAAGRVQLDPDRQVQGSVRLLFATFRRTGSAGAMVKAFREQGHRFPSRPPHGPRMGELVWQELTYSRALDVLHNPRYAGAYALGRTHQRKRANGRRTTRRLPREEWSVLIVDSHDGYIDWEQFEENQRRLKDNNACFFGGGKSASPPREGPALLQGIALCGVCGKRMRVHYYQREGRRTPLYLCPLGPLRWAADRCQQIPGQPIDDAIGELMVSVMSPLAIEVALSVQDEMETRVKEVEQMRNQRIERAQYESDAARRRYMQVDPDNRLVADALEADWNSKLRALTETREDCERRRRADECALGPEQRQRIASLASDFPTVWAAATTTHRDRKRMLRLLVEDVTLVKAAEAITVQVRFRGGGTQSLTLPRPVPSWKTWLTPSDVVAEVDRLLDHHTHAEIADHLNEGGYRSGKGHCFNARIISTIQRQYHLKSRYDRLRERGMFTADELAVRAGVSRKTVLRWRRDGLVSAHAYDARGQHLFDPTGELPKKNQRSTRTPNPGGAPDGLHSTEEVQYEA
jgi:DNA invertase Pin-like site-specific DNA recombinase